MWGASSDLVALTANGGMTSSDVRDANRRTVVAEILRQRPTASRASISRATGLTATTVSGVVASLVESSLVNEVRGESAGGKPPMTLAWNNEAGQIIAIDVSGSTGAVIDFRGRILVHRSWPEGHGRGRAALRLLVERATELANLASKPVLALGIAVPGVVQPDGVVTDSIALDWHHEMVSEPIQRQLGIPVQIINDTQSCALGEYWTGCALGEYWTEDTGAANFATVRIGEGVGAGIVLGGRLFGGSGSSAGEIGHLVVDPEGQRCGCGNVGCVETILAEPRLVERLVGVDPSLSEVLDEGPARLFAVAAEKSKAATAVRQEIESIGTDLGTAIAPLIVLLDIERIMIGGAVTNFGPVLLDAAISTARRRALPSLARRVDIRYSELGAHDALIGAAGAVFHATFGTL